MGQLAKSFDEMASLVEKRERARAEAEEELRKANAELDERVRQRTAELVLANESLREEIAGRRQLESVLRANEEMFRRWVENAPEAILVQTEGRFAYVNPMALKLFGAEAKEQLLGRPVLERVHSSCRELVKERIRLANVEKQPNPVSEQKYVRMDGAICEVETCAVPITYENREGALVFVRDISERKRNEEERTFLEQRLQQLRKAESLGRMAGGIAHQFNNILGAVIGNLELALHNAPRGAVRTKVSAALKATLRAAEFSRFMLTYVGLTSAKRAPLDLVEAVREALVRASASLPENIHLVTEFRPQAPIINTDGVQINQILTNLVTNAMEAIGRREGKIKVVVGVAAVEELRRLRLFPLDWEPWTENYATLSVSDTGCGMEEGDLEKIFDPFYSTKFTGRGMGLPIVLGLVRAQGGAIDVTSRPGAGASFRVFFPLPVEAFLQLAEEEPVSESTGNRPPVPGASRAK
jgi:PAS domain S-box-containing protein